MCTSHSLEGYTCTVCTSHSLSSQKVPNSNTRWTPGFLISDCGPVLSNVLGSRFSVHYFHICQSDMWDEYFWDVSPIDSLLTEPGNSSEPLIPAAFGGLWTSDSLAQTVPSHTHTHTHSSLGCVPSLNAIWLQVLQVPLGNHPSQCWHCSLDRLSFKIPHIAGLVLLSWCSLEEVLSLQACNYTFIWTYFAKSLACCYCHQRKT